MARNAPSQVIVMQNGISSKRKRIPVFSVEFVVETFDRKARAIRSDEPNKLEQREAAWWGVKARVQSTVPAWSQHFVY